ncbi:histidine kinase [Balamuthia mandrillaris]
MKATPAPSHGQHNGGCGYGDSAPAALNKTNEEEKTAKCPHHPPLQRQPTRKQLTEKLQAELRAAVQRVQSGQQFVQSAHQELLKVVQGLTVSRKGMIAYYHDGSNDHGAPAVRFCFSPEFNRFDRGVRLQQQQQQGDMMEQELKCNGEEEGEDKTLPTLLGRNDSMVPLEVLTAEEKEALQVILAQRAIVRPAQTQQQQSARIPAFIGLPFFMDKEGARSLQQQFEAQNMASLPASPFFSAPWSEDEEQNTENDEDDEDGRQKVLGVICLWGTEPLTAYSSEDVLLVEEVAGALGQLQSLYLLRKRAAKKLSQLSLMQRQTRLLNAITAVQTNFMVGDFTTRYDLFMHLLNELLNLTQSDYGFIGEVNVTDDGRLFASTWACTNVAWNDVTRDWFNRDFQTGLRIYRMDSLYGPVLKGEVVIANDTNTFGACGRPKGHPPLVRFLGLPIIRAGKVIGICALSNKETGYTKDDVAFLQPFLATFGGMIESFRTNEERLRVEKELKKAKEEAERLSHIKSQLLANTSHELKTPLHAIRALTDLILSSASAGGSPDESLLMEGLSSPGRTSTNSSGTSQENSRDSSRRGSHRSSRRGSATPIDAAQDYDELRSCVLSIRHSSNNLLYTVNQMLNYTRMDKGQIKLKEGKLNVVKLLEGVVSLLTPLAVEKGLGLIVRPDPKLPPTIIGDKAKLQTVLLTLGRNAIKFTKTGYIALGASLDLSGEIPSKDNNRARILFSVEDSGVGITPEQKERIFSPFSSLEGEAGSATREYGGTGLGLPIALKIVQNMGGNIKVDTQPNRGSTFTVDITFLLRPEEKISLATTPTEPELDTDDSSRSGEFNAIMDQTTEEELSDANDDDFEQDEEAMIPELRRDSWDGKVNHELDLSSLQIVLVDPTEVTRHSLAAMVERWGCKYIWEAESFEIARSILLKDLPAVVSSARHNSNNDLQVLIMVDGDHLPHYESWLKEELRFSKAWKVIILRTLSLPSEMQKIQRQGWEHLSKPVVLSNFQRLFERLTKIPPQPSKPDVDSPPITSSQLPVPTSNKEPTAPGPTTPTPSSSTEAPPPSSPATKETATVVRALVVDDLALNRIVLKKMLQRIVPSMIVEMAADGQEAVNLLQKRNFTPQNDGEKQRTADAFDLVFLDIMMPVMDGITAAQKIREMEKAYLQRDEEEQYNGKVLFAGGEPPRNSALLPLIAVSASTPEEQERMSIEAGMSSYITKPVPLNALRNILLQYLVSLKLERLGSA